VIVPDTNILLYAEVSSFPGHAVARTWWERALSGTEAVGLAPVAFFGFLRLVTNPRIFSPAIDVDIAIRRVETWLAFPHVRVLVPGPRHLEIAFRLLRAAGTGANLTTDVQLAAFALENNATLCSNDADFGRFSGLSLENPLEE
jgi:toxin-antitoxin system PIN domain toxin